MPQYSQLNPFLAAPNSWRFWCGCCNALHSLNEQQIKGGSFYCEQQDMDATDEIGMYLDAVGKMMVPHCDVYTKKVNMGPYPYDGSGPF